MCLSEKDRTFRTNEGLPPTSFLLDVVVPLRPGRIAIRVRAVAPDTTPSPLSWDAVTNAVDSLGLHGPRFGRLYEMIAMLKPDRGADAI
jgi:hypothetical protein